MNWLRWRLTKLTVANITPGSSFQLQRPAAKVTVSRYLVGCSATSTARAGNLVPGATISPQHLYNLAQLGLAWHPDVEAEPEFAQFVAEMKEEIRGS